TSATRRTRSRTSASTPTRGWRRSWRTSRSRSTYTRPARRCRPRASGTPPAARWRREPGSLRPELQRRGDSFAAEGAREQALDVQPVPHGLARHGDRALAEAVDPREQLVRGVV